MHDIDDEQDGNEEGKAEKGGKREGVPFRHVAPDIYTHNVVIFIDIEQYLYFRCRLTFSVGLCPMTFRKE